MSKEYSLLLVEDEKNILYGMKNVLACTLNRLSEVLTAENGKEALDVIEMAHPDMIITDLRMPEMDGIALVKEIRARQYTMPIIVLTAIADFEKLGETDPLFAKLAEITKRHNGLWSAEAEKYLLANK